MRLVSLRTSGSRRGAATLWMVIWLPCLMALFCALVGVGNLWLARIELENALEGAALAAVKHWGDSGGSSTLDARDVGVAYALANSVRGEPVVIGTNAGGGPNENDQCEVGQNPLGGNLIFGAVDYSNPSNVTLDASATPNCAMNLPRGVRAQAIVAVQPLGFAPFLGSITQYHIQAKTTAQYDCATGRPKLIRVDSFICP